MKSITISANIDKVKDWCSANISLNSIQMIYMNINDIPQEYISSSWNLNNLPILPRSLLRYIDVEINGMKVRGFNYLK